MLIGYRCAQHLGGIPHQHWADYAFPTLRYGHYTSNLVEQQNWVYLQAREKPVLDMLQHIWNDMLAKLFNRKVTAETQPGPLANEALLQFRQAEDNARMYDTLTSSRSLALVSLRRNRQLEFVVRLDERTGRGDCTCGRFQNDLQPCEHGHAVVDQLNIPSLRFVAKFFTQTAWIKTYTALLPPILRSTHCLLKSCFNHLARRRKGEGLPQRARRRGPRGKVGKACMGRY